MKVGIIGFGSMGQNHARVIERIRGGVFIGSYDSAYDSERKSAKYGKNSLKELLSESPDYLVIASPTPTHFSLIMELIETKIPLLVEKPVCCLDSELRELREVLSRTEHKIAVGHVERFNPAVISARKILQSGTLGEIISIDTFRKGPSPNRNLGVGVSLDLMSHDIDTTMWITGDKYLTKASRSISLPQSRFEDFSIFQCVTSRGTIIRHQVDWISPIKIRQSRVLGSRAMLTIDTVKNTVLLASRTEAGSKIEIVNPDPSAVEPLEMEHIHFQRLIRGEASDIATIQEALDVVEIILNRN